MTTYESVEYHANPGEERSRLWRKEKQHEIELKSRELTRDINADLGQRVRDILLHTPYDFGAVARLCQEAEKQEAEIAGMLSEGIEAETARLRTGFMNAALDHPGEPDPTEEIRARIKRDPHLQTQPEVYCSPVLMQTLLFEGMDALPNTHRKRIELDFPDRVEGLLDFHCIAFHADVNVMKKLYDEDTCRSKAETQKVLAQHRTEMERLMVNLSREMHQRWVEQKQRLRMSNVQGSPPLQRGINTLPPSSPIASLASGRQNIQRTSTFQKPTTTEFPPLHGIPKQPGGHRTDAAASSHVAAASNTRVAVESLTFDEESDVDLPNSFVLDELRGMEVAEGEVLPSNRQYWEPEIVVAPRSQQRYV
ncbi:hypothetical protein R3P38DRAFT_1290586 [Favolaschia claudopus]|uniref:Uncharacterized protein n=1 Tax=Favolaschia claudopus TaxID=2862362 RepID=A0AAW0B0V0_9AGAR